jgi:phage-related minor tail protein
MTTHNGDRGVSVSPTTQRGLATRSHGCKEHQRVPTGHSRQAAPDQSPTQQDDAPHVRSLQDATTLATLGHSAALPQRGHNPALSATPWRKQLEMTLQCWLSLGLGWVLTSWQKKKRKARVLYSRILPGTKFTILAYTSTSVLVQSYREPYYSTQVRVLYSTLSSTCTYCANS